MPSLTWQLVNLTGSCGEMESWRWTHKMLKNLEFATHRFLRGMQYLILDRDPLYSAAFRTTLKLARVKVIRLPPRSPDLNALAERFVLSIKSECLNRIVPLGERHLRRVISDFVERSSTFWYRTGCLDAVLSAVTGAALRLQSGDKTAHVALPHLGGIHNEYMRNAARFGDSSVRASLRLSIKRATPTSRRPRAFGTAPGRCRSARTPEASGARA